MKIFKTTKDCLKCGKTLYLKSTLAAKILTEPDGQHYIKWGKYFCKECGYIRKVVTHFTEEERDNECMSKGI